MGPRSSLFRDLQEVTSGVHRFTRYDGLYPKIFGNIFNFVTFYPKFTGSFCCGFVTFLTKTVCRKKTYLFVSREKLRLLSVKIVSINFGPLISVFDG